MTGQTSHQEPTDDRELTARLQQLAEQIAAAATEAGRDPAGVRMLLASKTVPADRIAVALRAGHTLIGENRVQEITGKAEQLSAIPHRTHLIGHLQRNKVNAVLPWISCLQSLDSVSLAERLDRVLATRIEAGDDPQDRVLDVMVQVNVSGEGSKFGVRPEATAELLDAIADLPRLRSAGLMTIGLNSTDIAAVRRGYAVLRALRDDLLPGGELSMGMSGDFAAAIAEGATIVRIGSAAFGSRPPITHP